jgi:hypothetical protein
MIVVKTDILRITIFSIPTCVIGAACYSRRTRSFKTVISRSAIAVDFAGRGDRRTEVIAADFSGRTIGVDGTSECLTDANVVFAYVARRTFGIVVTAE